MTNKNLRGWKSREKTIFPKSYAKTCEICRNKANLSIAFYDGRGSFREQAVLCSDCWKQELKSYD